MNVVAINEGLQRLLVRLRVRATLRVSMFVPPHAARIARTLATTCAALLLACSSTPGSSDDDSAPGAGTGGTGSGAAGVSTAGTGAFAGATSGGEGGTAGAATAGQGGAGASGAAGAGAGGASGVGGMSGVSGAAGTNGVAGGLGGAGSSGSAGADAGSAGVSAGAAGSAGASTDPCSARPGLLVCESFEGVESGALPDDPRWTTTIIGEGTLEVDASIGHTGAKSLLVRGLGFQTLLTFHDASILPPASGRLFVRAFVRLAEPMTGGHNTFIIADTAAAPGQGNAARLGEMAEMLMLTVTGDTHGALSNDNHYTDGLPGVVLPPSEFTCLELLFDSAAQEINTWVEGVEVPDLHRTDWPVDAYDALRFGFEQYAGPVSDIWYDDIAIGTEPIGCE
jgi:hypothetical protein